MVYKYKVSTYARADTFHKENYTIMEYVYQKFDLGKSMNKRLTNLELF